MNADERIAALEAGVAEMKAQLAYERSEREALTKILLPDLRTLHEDQKTSDLKSDYVLERLEQLLARTKGGDDSEWAAVFVDFVRDYIRTSRCETASFCALADRVRWLEEGRLKDAERLAKLLGIDVGSQAA